MESEAFEVLYGGEAGGGKSDLILGVARLQHRNAAIFRRTYTRLDDSAIPRSIEFFGDRRFYNASKHYWEFPSGQRIAFRHLEREYDIFSYKSAAFDFIGMDEVTEFTQTQYEYMFSRVRSAKPGQRTRIIACTNPASEQEGMWVFNRWSAWLDEKHPNPAEDGELRWYARNEEGQEFECDEGHPDAKSRTFIRARLADNQYLGDDYRQTLASLPEPYRSQLMLGVWGASIEDDRWQVIPTAWVKLAQERWNNVDVDGSNSIDSIGVDVAHGGSDKTVLAFRRGSLFSLDKYPGRTTPDGQTVAQLIFQAIEGLEDEPQVNIDAIGVGASAYDFCKDMCNARAFVASEKSDKRDRSGRLSFSNKRAEAYWRFREALDPHSGDNIALPPDQELLADLCSARWKMQANGIKIESKDEIIKRIGRSPDCGDAVVMAYWGSDEVDAAGISINPQSMIKRRYR